jgi:hypothetical protein
VLLKEGTGGDGVAVGMRKVGDTTPAANVPSISGGLVNGQGDPIGAVLNITSSPTSRSVIANESTTFQVSATNFTHYTTNVWYQWLKGGAPIAGAINRTYTIPVVATTDNAAQFSVLVGSVGIVKTSAVATLTVTADTKKPVLARASGTESLDSVTVRFSEPVTAPTATTAGNYTFSGGVTVSTATVVDPFTVRLATTGQVDGTVYTLTVNNVADNAGNVIEANSAINYKAWGLVPNRAKMEIWDGITGTTMDLLYADPKYPNAVDRVLYTPGLNTPDGTGDNYGARARGFFIPTESGSFHFFLYSDDASELYLSSNDVFPTVPGATPVAQETDCCDIYVEPGIMNDDTTTSATTATPVALVAGQRYAIQAMLKEGGGGDYVRVAKRKVGDTTAAAASRPCPATSTARAGY